MKKSNKKLVDVTWFGGDKPAKIVDISHMCKKTAADLLVEMASTYYERNRVYGENWRMVGPVMAVLFPGGMTLKTADEFTEWHLFELMVVKLTRLATSGLKHVDSVHDLSVYGAMIEAFIKERQPNGKNTGNGQQKRTGAGPGNRAKKRPTRGD